jgi:hypothetical protein
MSALSDKILSYSPEQYIRFNTEYSTSPTNLGSGGTGQFTLNNEAPILNSTGGPDGEGSWILNTGYLNDVLDTSTTQFRVLSTTNVHTNPELTDNDYSVGFWFKTNGTLENANAHATNAINVYTTTSFKGGYAVTISGSGANSSTKGKLRFSSQAPATSAATFTTTARYDDQQWHYLAFRSAYDAETNITTLLAYIDGLLVKTSTYTLGTNVGFIISQLGQVTTNPASADMPSFEFSNLYIAPFSTIDGTAISEIYTAGTSPASTDIDFATTPAEASALSNDAFVIGNANILEAPSTASALQTEPTIAVETGDHIEITTSIPVSAEFPPATVSVETFLNIEVDPATAYSELINNIIVGSSNSVDFTPEEFLASAEIVKPFLSESPMIASAESGDHTVYVDPNYFNAVTELNPYVYINNGGFGSAVNYGSQQGTFARGSDMDGARDGGIPLNLVREGLSWQADGSSLNSDAFMTFTTATAAQHPAQLIGNGTFAFEFWAKPTGAMKSYINMPGILHLKELPAGSFNTPPARIGIDIKNSPSNVRSLEASNLTSFNNWNHFVINFYQSGINENQRLLQVWINGAIKINENIAFTPWTNTNTTDVFIGSNASGFDRISDGFFDEIAWYTAPLTNSQIINHYELISTLSPDHTEFTDPGTASADIGTHQFTVTSNAIPEIKEATASALFVDPTLIAGRSFTQNASPSTASATSIVPELSLGITAIADPMIAYAESANAFHLNSIYFDYVKANINPYRYVNFDSSISTEDTGTDNDYSVIPTVIGGQIVNPDEGINGKSAKTAGTSYVTDGVILKESEWDDTWGTGQFNYHSSFWVQKDPDDNSTGLRVLWNLNGYLDNQHVILFQYQGKLHMQFNNGSGTHLDSVTTSNIDLFDGLRHFVVIAFDHTNNNNNKVLLYVDSVLALTTNLGSYTGQTVNGTTFVGPNDEANNHPRLGVGCLITPFGVTALPVVPTNTKLIIDEIYWAKTAINQTGVTNLYNVMPDKNNADFASDIMTASALMVDPAISTEVNYVSGVATASALINEVTVIADRNIESLPLPATASVEFLDAQRLDNVIVAADVMVASAIFNSAGVVITIPGGPMLASAARIMPPLVNGVMITNLTAYVRYLRAQNNRGFYIPRLVEIK